MEYMLSPPSHGAGIFSTLSRIPGAQLLFVGPLVCMRHGILLTLSELHGRISYLRVEQTDVISGSYYEKTLAAAKEVINKRHASALILIFGCQNALLGTDYESLAQLISESEGVPTNYIEVNRLNLYAKQKRPLLSTPSGTLIYSFLHPAPRSEKCTVNLIGPAHMVADNELSDFLLHAGVAKVRLLDNCRDFADYLSMATAHLNIALTAADESVCSELSQRLSIPWLPLNAEFCPEKLNMQYRQIGAFLGVSDERLYVGRAECIKDRATALCLQEHFPICVESGNSAAGLELADWLLGSGFSVSTILLSEFSGISDAEIDRFILSHPHTTVTKRKYQPEVSPPGMGRLQSLRGEISAFPVGYAQFDFILDKIEGVMNQ